jgi:5'-methylthioadenosine phosphorylase
VEEITAATPYGDASAKYARYSFGDKEVYFLARHGAMHSKAPQSINYRANMYGFSKLGVTEIVAFTAVGGINSSYSPGDIVVPDNGIDFTNGRMGTYYDGNKVYHVDMTTPFCINSRKKVLKSAKKAGVQVHDGGTYICTNGPRYETAAEIKAFGKWGADIVGMTMFPECVLARELGICYTNVSIVTNLAAGISQERLHTGHVAQVMGDSNEKLKDIFQKYLTINSSPSCACPKSLDGNKLTKD